MVYTLLIATFASDKLIIDDREVYHIGASLKDLGKKMFAFSRLNVPAETITGLLKE